MLRTIALSLLLVVGTACPTTVQATDDVPSNSTDQVDVDLAFTEAVEEYEAQLASRADPCGRADAVREVLADFDGRILMGESLDGEFYVVLWNVEIENILILRGVEELALDPYTDEYGRPAFEGEDVSGWVDVVDDVLHLELTLWDDKVYHTIMEISSHWDGGGADQPLGFHVSRHKECVCKGSETKCPDDDDCQNLQPCTLADGTGSKCKRYWVTDRTVPLDHDQAGDSRMTVPWP